MHEVAIVGAGPYGLSIAAHLRNRSIPFRIFGPAMDTWISHMPKGMCLKSDGFASDLYDPHRAFTLKTFCADRGIPYKEMGLPVELETFTSYGVAFSERMVPELENKMVQGIRRDGDGFELLLENGETCKAKRVILAVGITHFEYVPEALARLPEEFVSHSARHKDPGKLKGKDVVVLGGGASALDLAGLLHAAGANVQLIARKPQLNFHSKPTGKPRSFWKKLRHPDSGLGPGLRSRFYANAPWAFRYLPESLRLKVVKRALGPSGGYIVHDRVMGKVPLLLGYTTDRAEIRGNKVHLFLRDQQGERREVVIDHVIAATGYRVGIDRLQFLNHDIRGQIRTKDGSPVLSRRFESSVPGLYFAGLASANTFGPVMRFAFGAGFAARRISDAVVKSIAISPVKVSASQLAVSEK